MNPAGTRVYVANNGNGSNSVSVIDTATNTVIATVPVGTWPRGVSVNPAGTRVYVANGGSNNVSVIDTATNTVVATVLVGDWPDAYGQFIGPAPVAPPATSVVPTMNEWGMTIFMVFAGLSSVYYMRRQRRT